jgi:hypothetical protein
MRQRQYNPIQTLGQVECLFAERHSTLADCFL